MNSSTSTLDFREQIIILSANHTLDNKLNLEIYNDLQLFYSINKRHQYSQLSDIVFQQDEGNEILEYNLEKLIQIAAKEKSIYIDNFIKLKDHLSLCVIQKKYIENNVLKIKDEIKSAKDLIDSTVIETTTITEKLIGNVTGELELQNQKVDDFELRSKKIYADFVSILGIFSAVIFAAFGGLEVLKNILGNIQDVQTGKLLVFSSLTISAIIILVFILLNGISKLTSLNLRSCNCNIDDCDCNLVQKHPSLILIHIFLVLVMGLGFTEYFINYKELLADLTESLNSLILLGSVILGVILFLIISLTLFKKSYKKNK